MKSLLRSFFKTLLLLIIIYVPGGAFAQTTLYSESSSGDLPNTGSGPTLSITSAGTYVVSGTLATPSDGQDRFQIDVGSGLQLTAVSYSMSGGSISGGLDFGGMGSATAPGSGSVSISPFTYPLSSGTYATVMFANFSTGSSWSMTFTITSTGGSSCTAPSVTTNPSSQTACSGGTASFTSAASGTSPSVQWQLSTNGGSTYNDISGATSTTLSFTTSASQNGYMYRAAFSNTCGNATTTAATLTVNSAPTVTTNPSNQTLCAGNTVTFTAAGTGTPAPTVQWQQSTNGGTSYSNISGATSTTLSFTSSASQNGYKYRAVFTNSCNTATTSAATLTVNSAPAITTNPSDQTICSGNTATFTVAASGTPTPTVQWQQSTDGGTSYNNISGATSATLSFTTSIAQSGYKYRAVLTNTCGTATSAAATLTVNTAAAITTNPTDVTLCSGNTATFTAAASGTPTPTVQWQQSTDGGTTYSNISGATSTTLSFTTSASQSGYKYRAVFTNSCNIATTTVATLTVNTASTVTTNPTDQVICAGNTATFTVAASGTPTPTVQWQLSTDGGSTYNNISGATSATLSFTTSASQSGYKYRAVFTNTCGTATSTAATLTVNTATVITTNPTDVTLCAGSTATFTAAASGTPAPTVQWQLSTDGGSTYNNISGATSTTLSFTTSASQSGYKYRAVFTNTCAVATTTAATLTVNTATAITTNPTDVTLCAGSTVTFTAAASGIPTPTVQWQLSTDGGTTYNDISGATSGTLSFTSSASQSGYKYRAVFTNTCGTAATTAATLTVNTATVITTNPTDVTLCAGSTATFTAAASGTPTPTVQWQVSTDGGTTYNNISGATSTTLSFTSSASQSGYKYRAVFTNVCAVATTTAATLTVNTATTVTTNPVSQTLCEGSVVTFTAGASGIPTPTVQWQLSTDGGTTYNDISGATSGTLSFTVSASQTGYKYRAVFTNVCAVATTTAATLTVNTATTITTNPANQTLCEGSVVTFTSAASGIPTPTVQWQLSTDGGTTYNNISGATSGMLSFAISASQTGYKYRAVYTNVCSVATTTAATLTVNTATTVTTNPVSQTLCEGSVVTFTAGASGIPTPTVQWQVSTDGGTTYSNITGATATSLSFTTVASQTGNKYRAVFTNICAVATTTAATLTVNTATTITTNPASQTLCEGNMVTFTAGASGIPTPTVQWQVSTDGGTTYSNITGATATSLSFTTIASQSGNKYRAVFTNICAVATTTAATLTVNTAPVITSQPSASVICEGSNTAFHIAATGTALTYQWQVNKGTGFANIAASAMYSGTNMPDLNITAATIAMSGYQYRCIVSGTCPPSVTSNAVILTVDTIPVVKTQPIPVTTCSGNTAVFSVAAIGTAITYQWQVNAGVGFTNVPAASPYTGSNTNTLSIVTNDTMSGYQYRCVVSGTCAPAATSSAVKLTVDTLPAIVIQPVNAVTCEHDTVRFSLLAKGTGVKYLWQVNNGSGFIDVPPISIYQGLYSNTLTINDPPAYFNNYTFRCIVSGTCTPAVISNADTLVVHTAPKIVTQPSSITVCNTANTSLQVIATGTALTYQWQVNTGSGFGDITNAGPYNGATSATLSITPATIDMNNYQYRCIISGTCPPVDTTRTVILSVTNSAEWTGAVDDKWSNVNNWGCGILPIATANVIIRSSAAHMPVVDFSDAVCDTLRIYPGASVSFAGAGSVLNVKGSIFNSGVFDASNGTVAFSGVGTQVIPVATYKKLVLSEYGDKQLYGNITIADSLQLEKGVLALGNNNLVMGMAAYISGGDTGSYIATVGRGVVQVQNVGTGGRTDTIYVPVSTDHSSFTPLWLTNAGVADTFSVYCFDSAYSLYSRGVITHSDGITNNVVNKSWLVNENTPGGSDVTLTLQWNQQDQLGGFNPEACYISHYLYPSWQPAAVIAHATDITGLGTYNITLPGITDLSIFGVGSSFTPTAYTPHNGTLTVYPNPTSGSQIYLKFNITPGDDVIIHITNLSGVELYSKRENPYNYTDGIVPVDISALVPGDYIIRVDDVTINHEIRSAKFIKTN